MFTHLPSLQPLTLKHVEYKHPGRNFPFPSKRSNCLNGLFYVWEQLWVCLPARTRYWCRKIKMNALEKLILEKWIFYRFFTWHFQMKTFCDKNQNIFAIKFPRFLFPIFHISLIVRKFYGILWYLSEIREFTKLKEIEANKTHFAQFSLRQISLGIFLKESE